MADRRSLWRHADFMRLWTGQSVSEVGTQVTLLAMPLVAIKVLHASTFEVGLLTTVETLPFLLIGLPAGVWVDRLARRRLLVVTDLARAALLATVPVAAVAGALHLAQLYVVTALVGVCTVFFEVAWQSYLPAVVSRDELADGNGKLEISRSGAQIAGPGLAGALIGLLGSAKAITVDALSYIASALALLSIRTKEEPAPRSERRPMRADIAEGIGYVWRHPLLRPSALATGTSNLFSSATTAIIVVFMSRTLRMGPGTIGLVFAVSNVGFLLGAAVSTRFLRWVGVGPGTIAALVGSAVSALAVPLATPRTAVPVLCASMFVWTFLVAPYNIGQVSYRQAITPSRILGRMNASMRFINWGTMPLGGVLGGALGTWLGLRGALWVAAVGGLTAWLWLIRSPWTAVRAIPDAAPDGSDGAPVSGAPADGEATSPSQLG